jgi:hypothetical protein
MRFPLRLTADLALRLALKPVRGKNQPSPILYFAPMEQQPPTSHAAKKSHKAHKSAEELPSAVRDSSAPIVWLAGPDPLLHPATARWTRALLAAGRHVFLQTEGNLLRRRIHEFQPVPRFSFVVEFNGLPDSHDLRAGRAGAFHASAEGIRVAKLSGFLTCAHTTIDAGTAIDELPPLSEYLRALKVDGWVIVSALTTQSRPANSSPNLLQARQWIPSRQWRSFSELVQAASTPRHSIEPTARELSPQPRSRPDACDACGESVQVP